MSIGSRDKRFNENLDNASTIIDMTKAMTENSSIVDNLEDVTDSCLQTESLIRAPDAAIEEFMASTNDD